MRSVDEFRSLIDGGFVEPFGYETDQDTEYNKGFNAGMRKGLQLTQEGKTNQEIYEYVLTVQSSYVSRGADLEDAWQSGYTCALEWAAERFDWNEDGAPLFRTDVWGEPPSGW